MGGCSCTTGTESCNCCGYSDYTGTYTQNNDFSPVGTIIDNMYSEELEIILNNAYNKSMFKYILLSFELIPKKAIKLIIPIKKKKAFIRQNVGAINYKKAA